MFTVWSTMPISGAAKYDLEVAVRVPREGADAVALPDAEPGSARPRRQTRPQKSA